MKPRGGRYLNLFAADLGRGPDGQWWVLNDRAQAPSGLGYALENRLILSRAFQTIYRDMNVGGWRRFSRPSGPASPRMATRSDPRICLHTPGPYSETYYEQAYLARYLGFLLVEGGDLVSRDGKAHVRTIAGLKRADVIWRRIDCDFADPLELNGRSHLGVPGLVEAMREGNVAIANALGSGVLETPAMIGFMPKLCRTPAWRRAHPAEYRDLVVRPGDRSANMCSTAIADHGHLAGVRRLDDPDLARASSRRRRRTVGRAARKARHIAFAERGVDYLRPGSRQSVDDAGLGGQQAGAAPFRSARLCGAGRRTAYISHARRLLPHFRPRRFARRRHGAGGADLGRLDARRQSGRADHLLPSGETVAHPPHHGQSAEPRRRQPVLARALSGARRGDLAADPLPGRRTIENEDMSQEGAATTQRLANCSPTGAPFPQNPKSR